MTATPKRLLRALDARDGHVCAWHGPQCDPDTLVPQHRASRGMGGRLSAMVIENLVWLDSWQNGLLESDSAVAAIALARGIKISSHRDPSQVPVWLDEAWWLLNPDGTRSQLTWDEAAELRALYGMGE
jgi:hypothetical protein